MSGMPNFTPNMNGMGYQQPQATSINVIILPDISMADQYPVGPGSRLMFINEKMTEFRMKGRDTAGLPLPDRIWSMKETTPPPTAPGGDYVSKEEFKKVTDTLSRLETMLSKIVE